jgi:hypothetical protein
LHYDPEPERRDLPWGGGARRCSPIVALATESLRGIYLYKALGHRPARSRW